MSDNSKAEPQNNSDDSELKNTNVDRGITDKKHFVEKYLAVLATISLLLNVYLIYDKVTQGAIEQPGPHVFRVMMSGFDTSLAKALNDNKELITEGFGNPRFAITPEWTTLKTKFSNIPPIRLRRLKYRFLALQNQTSSTYIGTKVFADDKMLADIGSLEPNTTTFLYYTEERNLSSGIVKYQVHGENKDREIQLPSKPRDALEFLTKVSTGSIQRLGSLENVDSRLKTLLDAVTSPGTNN